MSEYSANICCIRKLHNEWKQSIKFRKQIMFGCWIKWPNNQFVSCTFSNVSNLFNTTENGSCAGDQKCGNIQCSTLPVKKTVQNSHLNEKLFHYITCTNSPWHKHNNWTLNWHRTTKHLKTYRSWLMFQRLRLHSPPIDFKLLCASKSGGIVGKQNRVSEAAANCKMQINSRGKWG